MKHGAWAILLSSVFILGCSASSDEEDNGWETTTLFSANHEISKPRVNAAPNGSLIVVWQEHEDGSIIEDTVQNAIHDAERADANQGHGDHDHYYQCQRTNVWARIYSNGSWSSSTKLQTGKWRKTRTYLVDNSITSPTSSDFTLDEKLGNFLDTRINAAMDSSGRAVAMWVQDSADNCVADPAPNTAPVLNMATFSNGSWSTPGTLQRDVLDDQGNPLASQEDVSNVQAIEIALNAGGDGLIIWQEAIDTQNNQASLGAQNLSILYGAPYTAAGGVGAITQLSDSETHSDGFTLNHQADTPMAAVDSSGNGIAVWRQVARKSALTDTPIPAIMTRRYTSGTGWDATTTSVSNATSTAEPSSIALSATGVAWIAWQEPSTSGYSVWANSLSAANVAGTPAALQTDDAATTTVDESTLASYDISIAVDANDQAFAIWTQKDQGSGGDGIWNNNQDIKLRWATNTTGTWNNASSIDAGSRLDAHAPQATHLSGDEIITAWTRLNEPRRQSGYSVQARIYSFTNGWQTTETVATTGVEGNTQIKSGGGKSIVVWNGTRSVRAATK